MDGGGTTPGMGEVESSQEQRPRAASGTKAESEAGGQSRGDKISHIINLNILDGIQAP